MSPSPPGRKAFWLLPIVVLACAVMILPGGTFVASAGHAGNSMAAAVGLSSKAAPSAPNLPTAPSSSSYGSSTPLSVFSHVSPEFADAPWVQSLAGTGPAVRPTVSLPNIDILTGESKTQGVAAQIAPGYTNPPAPLGLGDFGLGAQTYSYNASHFLGQVTFNTPPNATNPSASGVTIPSAQREGFIGSPYTFGIQLNTIATNITIPGSNVEFFWTQNVVNWNDTGIHFVSDTFNASGNGVIEPGTIASGCNNNTPAGIQNILTVYGGVFQCVAGTVPVSAASYPVTLELYNNATVNAKNQSQVAYGYRIVEAGTDTVFTGYYNIVAFTNPNATAPVNKPGFSVDGFSETPGGFYRDSEIVLVGGIGGSNAAFRSVNGTVNLEYSNLTTGGYANVPSAYNFGGDTGETSVGIADYYTASHTLVMNTGPSMLYGLWNSVPHVAVKSGDIQVSGSISPSFGFVFLGNLAPDVYGTNLSWFPTTDSGTFNTYLPPLGAPWTTDYYVQAFAAGYAETNGTAITGSTTTYTLTLTAAPGVIRAPLYMFSNAQASALADAVTGSAAPPYDFKGLTVNMNYTFNHVNDYTYPVFDMFMSQGVTQAVYVNDTYQGQDSTTGNYYFYDQPAVHPHGLLSPTAEIFPFSLGSYNSQINIFGGTGDQVTDEVLSGITFYLPFPMAGGEVVLWQDTGAYVSGIISEDGSPGVNVGDSLDTWVGNELIGASVGVYIATGVDDISSSHTTVWNQYVTDDGLGVLAFSSTDGTYSWINVTDGSVGIEAGNDAGYNYFWGTNGLHDPYYYLAGTKGLTVNWLNATYGSLGANMTFSDGTTFNNASGYDPVDLDTLVAELDGTVDTTFNNLVANYAAGVYAWNATDTTFNTLTLENWDEFFGSIFDASTGVTATGVTVFDDTIGFIAGFDVGSTDLSFTNVQVTFATYGFVFVGSAAISFTNFNVTDIEDAGIFVEDSTGVTATNIVGYGVIALETTGTDDITATNVLSTFFDFEPAVVLADGSTATLTNVVATDDSIGVVFDDFSTATVTTVSASVDSTGVLAVDGSTLISVTGVSSSSDSYGVDFDDTSYVTVTSVTASDPSVGVYSEYSEWVTVSKITASNESIGVWVYDDYWTTVSTATVTNESVALYSEDSTFTSITGVTATNKTLSYFYGYGNPFDLPAIAAIVTYDDDYDSISNVVANTYPLAYYDQYSYDPGVDNVNGTAGWAAVYLYETDAGVFTKIGAYQDFIGFYAEDTYGNVITMSSFVDCVSYGMSLYGGYDDVAYDNNFIGNNGAGSTYSAAHIQAYDGYGSDNYYYFDGVGNYWSDWHQYLANGELAPYPLGDYSFDYYPLGGPEGTVAVYFYESGLLSGVSWSVTFNGATQTTTNDWAVFYVLPGTYSFTAGAVTGYTVSPGSGSVMAVESATAEYLSYTGEYAVKVTESGLPAGTSWTATVGGLSATGTTAALSVSLNSGTYSFQITPVAGYSASPSTGTITVGTSPYNLTVTFTQVTYAVTVSESGLASGQTWSATINGVTQSSTGATITFYVPNGSYMVKVANVSGYSVSSNSVAVTISGSPSGAAVSFSPSSTTSLVSSSTFNEWLAVAIAIAVIALVLGLLALFMRRGKEPQSSAQPWSPPPSGSTGGTPPASGGSGSWSEGPPAGGTPPS